MKQKVKKFKADQQYWKGEKEKYEEQLAEESKKDEPDKDTIAWLRDQIKECNKHLADTHKSINDLSGKKWGAIGAGVGTCLAVLGKLIYTQIRYARNRVFDKTQYEEDLYDETNKRSSF